MAKNSETESNSGRPGRPLPWFLPGYLEVMMIAAFLAFSFQFAGYDLWWHLATGRLIWETGGIPHLDTLSTGSEGKPWTAHYWLWCLIAYQLVKLGGVSLLLHVKAAFAALTVQILGLLYREVGIRNTSPLVVTLLIGISGLHSQFWNLRAQMTTAVCVPLVTWLLVRGKNQERTFWLPLLMIMAVWANCHGGFILGLGAWGVFLGMAGLRWLFLEGPFDPLKRLALSGAAMVAGCCLNPHGPSYILYPLGYLGNVHLQTRVSEWAGTVMRDHPLVEGLIVLLVILTLQVRARVPGEQTLLLTCCIHFMFQAVRNFFLLGPWLAPVVGLQLQALRDGLVADDEAGLEESPSPAVTDPRLDRSQLAWMVILVCLVILPRVRGDDQVLAPKVYPKVLVAHLKQNPPAMPLFNEFSLGGYVLWYLHPPTRPFVEGRADIHIGSGAFDEYTAIVDLSPRWEDLFFRKYAFRTALLEKGGYLAARLRERGWTDSGPLEDGFELLTAPAGSVTPVTSSPSPSASPSPPG